MTWVDWAQLGLNVATCGVLAYLSYCIVDTHGRIARLERLALWNQELTTGSLRSLLEILGRISMHAEERKQEEEEDK